MVEQDISSGSTGAEDSWTETKLFMRRPGLDDLPVLPPLREGCLLRPYEPGDLAALGILLTRSFDETWDEQHVRETLTDAPDVDTIYVIAHAGTLVATASALMTETGPRSGYLHWVGADPAFRGQGLGATVSLAVLRRFRELGLRDAMLETQNFRVPAVRSYLRMGFVPESRDVGEQQRWARLLPQLVR